MMKKKVKKIPKFAEGFDWLNAAGIAAAATKPIANAFGIELGAASEIANAVGDVTALIPGVGPFISAGIKTFANFAGGTGGTDGMGNATKATGLTRWLGLGRSDHSVLSQANREKNAINAKTQTQHLLSDYYNKQNVPTGGTILAAEGGIMREPVDALVSKGELIYDPVLKKLTKVPGNKGKANTDDDVFTTLLAGLIVVPNSDNSKKLTTNNKTVAYNLEPMVDKPNIKMSKGTIEARDRIIKKVSRLTEAIKDEPQEYAMFSGGGIAGVNKYGYNKNMSDFAYWDKDKNEYKKKYLDWVNTLTEQDVRDIEAGKYGDMAEYFSKNKGKKLDVATAQKLMTDKKYGNWHKIGQAFVDTKRANAKPLLPNLYDFGERHYLRGTLDKPITKLADAASITPTTLAKTKITAPSVTKTALVKEKGESNWLDEMSNLLPIIGGLSDKYDWHTESSQITPPRFVPVNADPRPLLRAADESLAMARYNQANISPNTGAGMAYGLQAASNRAKAYADAYKWQQETNNKLIAQNAGIYNDWRKQHDAYATQAIADTRANEGAAQQMKDQARKDRLEFYYGKQNDDMLTAMLKPMFEYGTPDEAYRLIYKRRIV